MELFEAEQIYLNHKKHTEEQINALGNNPQTINAYITNIYAELALRDPSFIWLSLGAIVSGKVGQNIQAATQGAIHTAGQSTSAQVSLNNFSEGNQNIFKDIVPLYLTYNSIGLVGVELLAKSITISAFKTEDIQNAMRAFSQLQEKQDIIAKSHDLPLNNAKVIAELFSDKSNLGLAHTIAMAIADTEQNIVQPMYKDELVSIMLDPYLGSIGNKFNLDEIKILDKSYNFFDYIDNPADIDQRLHYAEILLKAIEVGITSGKLESLQSDVQKTAEHTIWMANPHTASNAIGEVNGAYWGQQADDHDKKIKDRVQAFLNDEQTTEVVANPITPEDDNIFASIFSGEHEIVKINLDPLAVFLANNPSYEVIAHDFNELWNSSNYLRNPIYGGTAFWNPKISYLSNGTYLAIYNDGEYHYYQPHGEVRGISFPFIYDKNTGKPLTMPLLDDIGHYNHASTIDTIYNNPEAFNTPSHSNWYNPYWNSVLNQARQEVMNHYLKSITTDSFMNKILAPATSTVSYYNSAVQIELKGSDIIHANTNHIDFSPLNGFTKNVGSLVETMVLANGTTLATDKNGSFFCLNCSSSNAALLEPAANALFHQLI